MYEAFFQLKHKPFSLLPDPEFLFLSNKHAIALSLLDYCLSGQAGFCVITGEIGSGKTTLIRAFLGRVSRSFSVGLISNTHGSLTDIASWALNAFGQKPAGSTPAETYQELMAHLIAEYGAGRQCILIVDEAQNLTIEALEELRLLSNINTGKDLLLQMVLVGQPELLDKLRRPELSQFAQRIAVSHHLTPLPYGDTKQYVAHRLAVAGCDRPIFTEMAIGAIHYFSGGVPRLINSICDMALVYAFADGVATIDEDLVFRVVADRQRSGIAPYATSGSAEDPDVRAQISDLTRSTVPGPSRSIVEPRIPTEPVPLANDPAGDAPAEAKQPRERAEPVGRIFDSEPLQVQESGPDVPEESDEGDLILTVLSEDEGQDRALASSTEIAATGSASQNGSGSPMPGAKADGLAVRQLRMARPEAADRNLWSGTRAPADPDLWPSIAVDATGNVDRATQAVARSLRISGPSPGTAVPERRSWWRRGFSRMK